MGNKDNKNRKLYFTGIGSIFGTAVGGSLSIIITGEVIWAGIGTAIGLIVSAVIDSYQSKVNK